MEPLQLALFLLTATVASYIQTVTGFAFGLIMIGVVSGLELVAIDFTAIVISFLALANALIALKGNSKQLQWPIARAVLLGLAPSMVAGVLLLDFLSANAASSLRLVIGTTILAAGVFLMLKPHPYPHPSPTWSFGLAGFVGGFFGGLFSTSGPPIVYQLYRQPLDLMRIKSTLLLIFGTATISRISLVAYQGKISADILLVSAMAFPLIMGATLLGKRFPPPLSDRALRRCAFVLLSGMGLTLILL